MKDINQYIKFLNNYIEELNKHPKMDSYEVRACLKQATDMKYMIEQYYHVIYKYQDNDIKSIMSEYESREAYSGEYYFHESDVKDMMAKYGEAVKLSNTVIT